MDASQMKAAALAPMRAITAIEAEKAMAKFREVVTPAAVLEMIAEVERLQAGTAKDADPTVQDAEAFESSLNYRPERIAYGNNARGWIYGFVDTERAFKRFCSAHTKAGKPA